MKKLALALSLGFASLGAAQAQTYVPVEAKPMHFVFGMGYTFGGDKLATAYYENGADQNIKAGKGLVFLGGVEYRVSPEFSVQGTIGFHVDQAAADNGDMRFDRYPLELLGYYHVNQSVRVGGGLRYVISPALRTSGAGDIGDYQFKNSTSPVAEIEYLYSPQLGFKLRYANDRYKEKDSGGEAKGDHVGLIANFYF
jgi:hypothetical protein